MTGKGIPIRPDGTGRRVALVVGRFDADVAGGLVEGARGALREAGVADDDVHVFDVPGAFELAPACRQIAALGPEVDAIVALGAIVRGDTPHWDYLSQAVTTALQRLALEIDVPLAFGVLTTEDRTQALARADKGGRDKGGEAARAALAMAELYDRLRGTRAPAPGFRLP